MEHETMEQELIDTICNSFLEANSVIILKKMHEDSHLDRGMHTNVVRITHDEDNTFRLWFYDGEFVDHNIMYDIEDNFPHELHSSSSIDVGFISTMEEFVKVMGEYMLDNPDISVEMGDA